MISFKKALHTKDFVVTAELPLTPDSTRHTILQDAAVLRGWVDGYLLSDNLFGQPHMAPAYAAGILREDGFAPVVQLSSRNRNRIALMAEMLGARATGIESLMLVRGGVLPEGYSPRPKAVLDTDAKDLVRMAKLMNEDEGLDVADQFLIGAAAAVHDPAPDSNPDELNAKADAGVHFVITQPCLDIDVLRRYMDFLIAHRLLHRFSVVVSTAIVVSTAVANWLIDNRLGTIIPETEFARLENAAESEHEAIARAAAFVSDVRGIAGISGINFVLTGALNLIPRVLEASGIRHHES